MARDDDVRLHQWDEQGHQEHRPLENEGNTDVAGEKRKLSDQRASAGQLPQGGVSGGRGGNQGGQIEPSGAGQQSNEKDKQRQQTPNRGDTEHKEPVEDEGYSRADLMPGGMGKQGDQQQIQADDREKRKDKSRDKGGSDHMHGP
jgi:hypothetical protein